MTGTTSTRSKTTPRNPLLDELSQQFQVFREGRPLALGVHKAILEKMPEVDPAKLRVALRAYTASTRYLKALSVGRERFDLDNQPAGEVTEEQRALAIKVLRERFEKSVERKKAEASAEAERKLKEAQEQRQIKLTQLASRFNQR